MFFSRKKKAGKENRIILGMVMLSDHTGFDLNRVITDLTSNYVLPVENISGDNNTAAFDVDGETVAIGHMPIPVPAADLTTTAEYAYNWETALEDLQAHQSHLIVTSTGKGDDPVKQYTIFTFLICSLLRTTNSIGVYMGSQSLLIPQDHYLEEAARLSDDYLPLDLWIYFGFRITNKGQCGYTYGLQGFNKPEMEILNSAKGLEEIMGFLFNMSHYVIEHDVTFKEGQTCGMSAEEKVPITYSKGQLVTGKTFKLGY